MLNPPISTSYAKSVGTAAASVIIPKHRKGPIGSVKLLFELQFTRLRNLAGVGIPPVSRQQKSL